MKSTKLHAAAALLCLASVGNAHAFNYNEGADGDLAGTLSTSGGLAPTQLTATVGTNSISLGVPEGGDRDYFTFTVPAGHVLSSIVHTSYASTDNLSFMGFQAGAQLTEPFSGANPANLLGYLHFGPTTVGTDVLDNLANSDTSTPAAAGFDAPLIAGPYTFWVQQTGVQAAYSFDFAITPVPEPGQWALMLGGALLVAARVRRSRAA
jgi:hypothetical protein